jgi:hypothetical protein
MQVNCYLLRSQLLQLAHVIESKEYTADWLKGGKTVFRQGGKFASRNSNDKNSLETVSSQAIKKIGDMSNLLQKDISEASASTKKAITSFFNSPNLQKAVDAYTNKLESIQKGAGEDFKNLTKNGIKLYAEGKPEQAIKQAKPKFTDTLNAEGITVGLIAGAGLMVGAPMALVSYLGGSSLVLLSEAMGIKEFSLENILQVGGVAKGFNAINEGKEAPEILKAFAEGGKSQASFDTALAGLALGTTLVTYALQAQQDPAIIQLNPLDLNQTPSII